MKALLIALFVSLAGGPAAQAQSVNTEGVLPPEVSAVLLSPQYASLVAEHTELNRSHGQTLRLTGYSVLDLGEATFAYLTFVRRPSAALGNDPWIPYGSFVAQIARGPLGEVTIDGLWFQPTATPPGGGSVGN